MINKVNCILFAKLTENALSFTQAIQRYGVQDLHEHLLKDRCITTEYTYSNFRRDVSAMAKTHKGLLSHLEILWAICEIIEYPIVSLFDFKCTDSDNLCVTKDTKEELYYKEIKFNEKCIRSLKRKDKEASKHKGDKSLYDDIDDAIFNMTCQPNANQVTSQNQSPSLPYYNVEDTNNNQSILPPPHPYESGISNSIPEDEISDLDFRKNEDIFLDLIMGQNTIEEIDDEEFTEEDFDMEFDDFDPNEGMNFILTEKSNV
jgi:hypothetical protein